MMNYICAPAPDSRHARLAYNNVYVAEAAHGKGVFARRAFEYEAMIGRLSGKVIRDAGYASDYCIELARNLTLEPAQPFCYLNHSCEPNCELVWVAGPRGVPYLLLEALDDIGPGEQLTIDYAWPAGSAIPCGCGTINCRGWIVDEDELHELAG